MKKIVFTLTAAFALLFSFVPRLAVAQFVPGQILTAQQLNSAFAAVTANALPVSGGTLTGPLQGTAATFNSGSFASLSSSGPVTFSSPLAFSSGGTGATTALGATSNLQFQASLSGASGRSVASKLSDVVSILDFPVATRPGWPIARLAFRPR
ncbi:hypothetical protein [Burkholderia glumae]|uniref:hypothetical protein n=1 Tax=Burkholderia glumae TaxID=337 RepID=UPI001F3F02EA|nr:hypothetical protein [Burkholderia glumae]